MQDINKQRLAAAFADVSTKEDCEYLANLLKSQARSLQTRSGNDMRDPVDKELVEVAEALNSASTTFLYFSRH